MSDTNLFRPVEFNRVIYVAFESHLIEKLNSSELNPTKKRRVAPANNTAISIDLFSL